MVAIDHRDPNHVMTVTMLLCSKRGCTELNLVASQSNNVLHLGGNPELYRLTHLFHSVKKEHLILCYFHIGHLSKQ